MPKIFTSKSQKTGELGETIVVNYLLGKGFSVLERNYTKKWGEIDIVAKKGSMLHFIEVKSKSVLDLKDIFAQGHRAEEGMHVWKVARLKRTLQTYLLERRWAGKWQFDLAIVHLCQKDRLARVTVLENLIL
jgi:putative endonuclease